MFGRKMTAPVIRRNDWPQSALVGIRLGDRRVEPTEAAVIGMLSFGPLIFQESAVVTGRMIAMNIHVLSPSFR